MPVFGYQKDRTVGSGKWADVVPHDTNNIAVTHGIYIGGSGSVRMLSEFDDDVTFSSMQVGVIYPLHAKRVFATGTTATNIRALYLTP